MADSTTLFFGNPTVPSEVTAFGTLVSVKEKVSTGKEESTDTNGETKEVYQTGYKEEAEFTVEFKTAGARPLLGASFTYNTRIYYIESFDRSYERGKICTLVFTASTYPQLTTGAYRPAVIP